jgi:hypothetical protein
VKAGRSVFFSTLAELITSLARAEREGSLRERLRFLCRPQLLIVDEIGYLPVVPGGGNLFFQLVNARYERGAMILTSNRGFAEWGDVFGHPVVATALLDRLLHHAVVIQIEGASYRLRQHADLIPETLRVGPLASVTSPARPIAEARPGRACRRAWENYFAGSEEIYSAIDIFDDRPAKEPRIRRVGNPVDGGLARGEDLTARSTIECNPLPVDAPRAALPNISRAHDLLEWAPRVPLDTGLERTIALCDRLLTEAGEKKTAVLRPTERSLAHSRIAQGDARLRPRGLHAREGAVAGAVVCHALDFDAKLRVVADGRVEESNGAPFVLVLLDLGI